MIINFIFPQTPNSSAAGVEAVEALGLAFFEKGKEMTTVYGLYRTGKEAPKFEIFGSKEIARNSGSGFSIVEGRNCLSNISLFPTSFLVEIYNLKADRKIAKFRDRETAESRVWKMLSDQTNEPVEADAEPSKELNLKRPSFKGKMITALCKENPRRVGTGGFKSMQILIDAGGPISYEKFLEAGGRRQDFAWDLKYDGRVQIVD